MAYHLLTGATGLLGRYLLRNLLLEGLPVAVVVRASRRAKAIDRVEEVMTFWDRQLGRCLPRPVVLEGDLGEPCLGLSARDIDWVAAHCSHVLHNAASLTFQGDGKDGEPWRSNVEGTRQVLELSRRAGVRQFHHVSTAYVCGLRQGQVLESELNVGQKFGNDYEQSKVQAETMVREAEFLDGFTIFRPSIIVGDSQTGYTNTFHGFYTPLQLAITGARQGTTNSIESARSNILACLNLNGDDRKNFVPVDWVAGATSYLVARPEHHGRTYHLTAPNPTPARVVREVIERCMREFGEPVRRAKTGEESAPTGEMLTAFLEGFLEQMRVYQAYWRDDPRFDSTNTRLAAPHLPCPAMDSELLYRTAAFAIRANFGWPRTEPPRPEFDVHEHLAPLVQSARQARPASACELGLQVNGPGGGEWKLVVRDGQVLAAEAGLRPDSSPTYYLNSATFAAIARRQSSVAELLSAGCVVMATGVLPEATLVQVLEQVASPNQNIPARVALPNVTR